MGRIKNEYYLEPQYDTRKSFYKKARVVVEGDNKTLYSYNTKVCEIKMSPETKAEANILGFYSQTTTRHIKDFLYQYGLKVGNQQFLFENYTERGRQEVAEKEAKKAERLAKAEEKARLKAERAEKRLERLELKKEKLRKKITKELGDIFSPSEIEALVLAEL